MRHLSRSLNSALVDSLELPGCRGSWCGMERGHGGMEAEGGGRFGDTVNRLGARWSCQWTGRQRVIQGFFRPRARYAPPRTNPLWQRAMGEWGARLPPAVQPRISSAFQLPLAHAPS